MGSAVHAWACAVPQETHCVACFNVDYLIVAALLLLLLLQAQLDEAEQTLQQAARDKIEVMEELSQAQVSRDRHDSKF
jgi:cobalamin biosynthesis protein CobD/CbiB